jgi:endonuclease/exonuclease/phosphatase family metal-dependent hydrolase
VWGKSPKQRLPEIAAIAAWLEWWSTRIDTSGHDLFVLGDFNINRKDDENYLALLETGLKTPPELNDVARTVSSEDGPTGTFYDQIAWFPEKLKLRYTERAGRVDWKGKVLADIDENEVTYRISDHYPLWAEFAVSETDPV